MLSRLSSLLHGIGNWGRLLVALGGVSCLRSGVNYLMILNKRNWKCELVAVSSLYAISLIN